MAVITSLPRRLKRRKSISYLCILLVAYVGNRELDRKNSIASATKPHRRSHRSAQELDDAELQRAIRLSLQESNAASGRPGYVPSQPAPSNWAYSEPPIVDHSTRPSAIAEEEDDPDLRAAIEASLRDANAPKPSAPIPETPRLEDAPYTYPTYNQPQSLSTPPAPSSLPKLPNYDLAPLEADAIMTFNQTVEQLQAQGGKDISRYPAMNDLYEKASSLRPKLALSLDDAGRKEGQLPLFARLIPSLTHTQKCSPRCTINCQKL